MADLEKAIKGLRCLSTPYIQDMDERDCENCKYDNASCFLDVTADALELLKAQEPLKPVLKKIRLGFHTDAVHIEPCCGGCGHKIEAWYKYCSYCGRAVKLE